MPAEMTRSEFANTLKGGPNGFGMPEFVRQLVVDVPQRIPPDLAAKYADARLAAASSAGSVYGSGRLHTLVADGEVWVCLYADDSDAPTESA